MSWDTCNIFWTFLARKIQQISMHDYLVEFFHFLYFSMFLLGFQTFQILGACINGGLGAKSHRAITWSERFTKWRAAKRIVEGRGLAGTEVATKPPCRDKRR